MRVQLPLTSGFFWKARAKHSARPGLQLNWPFSSSDVSDAVASQARQIERLSGGGVFSINEKLEYDAKREGKR